MSGNTNKSTSSSAGGGMDSSTTEDVCGRADIVSDGLSSGTSATAETTATMQDISLADTTIENHNLNKSCPDTTELKKYLAFLIDKQIPQAEQYVKQAQHAIEGVSTRSLGHRVYYDRLVDADNWLKWPKEDRVAIERGIDHGSEMTEVEATRLERVKREVLRKLRDDEAEERYAAELEEGTEE